MEMWRSTVRSQYTIVISVNLAAKNVHFLLTMLSVNENRAKDFIIGAPCYRVEMKNAPKTSVLGAPCYMIQGKITSKISA